MLHDVIHHHEVKECVQPTQQHKHHTLTIQTPQTLQTLQIPQTLQTKQTKQTKQTLQTLQNNQFQQNATPSNHLIHITGCANGHMLADSVKFSTVNLATYPNIN